MHVVEPLDGWDMVGLKTIATMIVARPGHVAVLVGSGPPASVVAARASDVKVDAAAIVRAVTARFGGKGGGRPELAQGGGLDAAVVQFVRAELSREVKR
jgi:alanyl-tRNA synthetase